VLVRLVYSKQHDGGCWVSNSHFFASMHADAVFPP